MSKTFIFTKNFESNFIQTHWVSRKWGLTVYKMMCEYLYQQQFFHLHVIYSGYLEFWDTMYMHVSRKLISWPCWISIVSQRISDCFLHKISCIDANLNEVKSQFETFFFLKQTKNNVSLFTLSKYSLGICSSTKALSVIYKKKKKKRKSLESTEKPYSKNFCFKSDFKVYSHM